MIALVLAAAGAAASGFVACSSDQVTPTQDAAPDTIVVADGGGEDAGACGMRKVATIAALNDPSSKLKGAIGEGVLLRGVIATSGRILIARNNLKQSCTYGFFAADPAPTFQPYSGILLTETVAMPSDGGTSFCVPNDVTSFPSDIAIGDVFDVAGTYDSWAGTCAGDAGAVPPAAPQLTKLCGLTRTAKAPILPATVLPGDIAGGTSVQLQWANGPVRVTNVTAKTDLSPYGEFTLVQSNLLVGDRFYYPTWGSPTVKANQHFDEIVGVSFLDGCNWALMPRTICELKPVPRDAGALPACP